MARRPLSDRAVILLVGVAVIVAAVLLVLVVNAGPAKGAEQEPRDAVVQNGVVVGGHASSFRDLIAATPASGDWRYYATGAAPWEYRWLLEVACGETSGTEAATAGRVAVNGATCWPVLWDHGLIDGDPDACYYACGGWVAAEDFGAVDNAFDAVLEAWGVAAAAPAVGSGPGSGVTGRAESTVAVTGDPTVDRWHPLVAHYFPPEQVANALRVMACESEGNPNAKNPRSSASGLMQVVRSTWGWIAPMIDAPPFYEARFDPEWNIRIAAKLWEVGGWKHWVCA